MNKEIKVIQEKKKRTKSVYKIIALFNCA